MRSTRKNPRRAFARAMWAVLVVFVVAAAVFSYRANGVSPQSVVQGPAAAQDAGGSAGQTSFVDPVTGLPREPTAAELAQLQALRPATVSAPPVPIVSPTTGLEGLSLTEEQMVYSVATKNADGTVTVRDVTGARAAEKVVRDLPQPEGLQVEKGARNDR